MKEEHSRTCTYLMGSPAREFNEPLITRYSPCGLLPKILFRIPGSLLE